MFTISRNTGRSWVLPILLLLAAPVEAQRATLREVPRRELPTHIDGNSPAFWYEGELRLFSSTGFPEMISRARDQFGPWQSELVDLTLHNHVPVWVEAAWLDSDGTLFAWYHHEPSGVCGGSPLTSPEIGAAVSYDGGKTLIDLGIVLKSGVAPNCGAKNGFFAGGHGDFSVVPDSEGGFFYFLFTNYAGPVEEQGVVVARMALGDRNSPVGAVWKYHNGEWIEPGLGGRTTAVYRANVAWEHENADSFWGPAVHWNTFLGKYVMLLNRACCAPGWPQEGIYISFISSLGQPGGWGAPTRLLDAANIGVGPGYYPQVLGLEVGETDSVSGWYARLYVQGVSDWEIVFSP